MRRVILHTNLGRAPCVVAAMSAAIEAATVPLLLEIDNETRPRQAGAQRRGSDPRRHGRIQRSTTTTRPRFALAIGFLRRQGRRGGLRAASWSRVRGRARPDVVRRAGGRLVEVERPTAPDRGTGAEEAGEGASSASIRRTFPIEFVESPASAPGRSTARVRDAILINDLDRAHFLDTFGFAPACASISNGPCRAWAGRRAGPSSPDDPSRTDAAEADPRLWGDVIVARREIPTSYHLSVVDRRRTAGRHPCGQGQDLYAATGRPPGPARPPRPTRPTYHHHRLILGRTDGSCRRATALRGSPRCDRPDDTRIRSAELGFDAIGAGA